MANMRNKLIENKKHENGIHVPQLGTGYIEGILHISFPYDIFSHR